VHTIEHGPATERTLMGNSLLKRTFDLSASLLLLLILGLPMLAIALLVRLFMGSPVLFRQVRPGLNGMPFTILKYRTMTDTRGADGELLSDADRLVPLGRFLRATSLDELPELINVIKGEMSLVGPRPLRMEYLERYTPAQARRHQVRPGITGWAQVNGRQSIPFSRRLKLDVWYVDNASLWLDMRILLMTLSRTVRRSDVIHGQEVQDVDDVGLSQPKDIVRQ
jgi:lipopolysaccharide/colanic/teichoic acid biosynthesis glycosyltransferase